MRRHDFTDADRAACNALAHVALEAETLRAQVWHTDADRRELAKQVGALRDVLARAQQELLQGARP